MITGNMIVEARRIPRDDGVQLPWIAGDISIVEHLVKAVTTGDTLWNNVNAIAGESTALENPMPRLTRAARRLEPGWL